MPDVRAVAYDYSGPLALAIDLSEFRVMAYDYANFLALVFDTSEGDV